MDIIKAFFVGLATLPQLLFGSPQPVNLGASQTTTVQNLVVRYNAYDWAGNKYVTSSVGGGGSVSTSSAISQYHFPYWATTTGGLSGTSSIVQGLSPGYNWIDFNNDVIFNSGFTQVSGTDPFVDMRETDVNKRGGMYLNNGELNLYVGTNYVTLNGQIRFWNDLDIQGIEFAGNIIPDTHDTYDLGSNTNSWAGLWLGIDECINWDGVECVIGQSVSGSDLNLQPPNIGTTQRVTIGKTGQGAGTLHIVAHTSTEPGFVIMPATTTQALVGIGTTAPSSTLHVVGTSTLGNNVFIGGSLNVTSTATFQATTTIQSNSLVDAAGNKYSTSTPYLVYFTATGTQASVGLAAGGTIVRSLAIPAMQANDVLEVEFESFCGGNASTSLEVASTTFFKVANNNTRSRFIISIVNRGATNSQQTTGYYNNAGTTAAIGPSGATSAIDTSSAFNLNLVGYGTCTNTSEFMYAKLYRI